MGTPGMAHKTISSGLWSQLLALAAGKAAKPPARLAGAARGFWQLYAPIAEGRAETSFVLGQLGQSLDGRIATATGHSHYINGPEAIDHLHRLRALVDAVVVGIGTVLADDPQLTVRRVSGSQPARVVIDPNARLPRDARLLAEDGVPVFVVHGREPQVPGRATPILLPMREGHIHPPDIVAALAERGFKRLLIEGGAKTLSAFLAAGALDRLHLCVAPVVIGAGPIGLDLPPIDRLEAALRPEVSIHRLGADVLFDCRFPRK
jgi:diaminohydroxyphosphoribosylaminopyrimidine deaminase / 5-amino-6-(5-phosphoribosylamino)uracil reductase